MAARLFNRDVNTDDVDVDIPSAKRFRQAGGGRRAKAPEVRLSMFDCFLDIRGSLKEGYQRKCSLQNVKSFMKCGSSNRTHRFQLKNN